MLLPATLISSDRAIYPSFFLFAYVEFYQSELYTKDKKICLKSLQIIPRWGSIVFKLFFTFRVSLSII
jgi:hypothetical protein